MNLSAHFAGLLLVAILISPLCEATEAREKFPFGVYDKSDIDISEEGWQDYYARLIDSLDKNNINCLLLRPFKTVKPLILVLDQAEASGIGVVMSLGNPLSRKWDYAAPGYSFFNAYRHPAVIAYKYGDEPKDPSDLDNLKKQYHMVRRYHDLPVVTAVIGEIMDGSDDDFSVRAWRELSSRIRVARFYPARRTYEVSEWYKDKEVLPFVEWAKMMESVDDAPWWYIAQTFGKGLEKDNKSYWRMPTASEIRVMVHVALANGARGILGYAYQDHKGKLTGLVNDDLVPNHARDGSTPLHAYRELGALIRDHSSLLLRHEEDHFLAEASGSDILVTPRKDPLTNEKYVYLVNLDAENTSSGTLTVSIPGLAESVVDVYTGTGFSVVTTEEKSTIEYELSPGQGVLLRLTTTVDLAINK